MFLRHGVFGNPVIIGFWLGVSENEPKAMDVRG